MIPGSGETGWGWTALAVLFLVGIATVFAVPLFACLWRENSWLNRRRRR